MRKILMPVAAFALLATGVAANAASVVGTISAIDPAAPAITLSKKVYTLDKTVKVADLKVGEKVKVTYSVKAGKRDASSVVAAK